MERKSCHLQAAAAALGFLVLIFDSALALEGARAGIALCIQTVIPSLFPFFVLSAMLTGSLAVSPCKPLQILTRVLGIPASAASVLISAVLGGYPIGAKCVWDLYQQKQIHRDDAQRMLAFCSNAGPSFLFGMVSGFFPEGKMVWLLWLIHIASAFLTALAIPGNRSGPMPLPPAEAPANRTSMLSSARAMALVCCWVILFRLLIAFLIRWLLWAFPVWVQILIMGILELTNGCCSLVLITDVKLRFVLCSCLLAFGGICVLLQTISVTKGLSVRSYVTGKLIQTVFSFLLSGLIVFESGIYFASLVPITVFFLRKVQNRYRNPGALPV